MIQVIHPRLLGKSPQELFSPWRGRWTAWGPPQPITRFPIHSVPTAQGAQAGLGKGALLSVSLRPGSQAQLRAGPPPEIALSPELASWALH